MKKLFALLFSAVIFLPVSAFAAEDDLSHLTETVVSTVNGLAGRDLSREITEKDIDYSRAFKIYIGTDIFKLDSNNTEEIKAAFNDYIYELPIYIDRGTLIVNISKGLPLNENAEFTENERRQILENAGKWNVTAITQYRKRIDYMNDIKNEIGEVPDGTILVGGQPHFIYAAALIPDENGNAQKIVPLNGIPDRNEFTEFQISADRNVYDYQKVKEYAKTTPEAAPANFYGNGSSGVVFISLVGALTVTAVAAALVIFLKKQ